MAKRKTRTKKPATTKGRVAAGVGGAVAARFLGTGPITKASHSGVRKRIIAGKGPLPLTRARRTARAGSAAATVAGAAAGVAAYNSRHSARKSKGSGRGRQRRDRHGRFA